MKRYILLLITLMCVVSTYAQADREHIRRGNRFMRQGDYSSAINAYNRAIELDSTSSLSHYNLALAYDNNSQPGPARDEYMKALQYEVNPKYRAQIFHNMGVVFQKAALAESEQRKDSILQVAVNLYRESLRLNPHDDETRYNYLLCLRQLPPPSENNQQGESDQQNQEQQQQEENNQQNDQNGQNKDGQEQDEKQQEQQEQQSSEGQQKEQEQKQQPKDPQISKEAMEQMLQAAMRDEKKTQDKAQMRHASRKRPKKNW